MRMPVPAVFNSRLCTLCCVISALFSGKLWMRINHNFKFITVFEFVCNVNFYCREHTFMVANNFAVKNYIIFVFYTLCNKENSFAIICSILNICFIYPVPAFCLFILFAVVHIVHVAPVHVSGIVCLNVTGNSYFKKIFRFFIGCCSTEPLLIENHINSPLMYFLFGV